MYTYVQVKCGFCLPSTKNENEYDEMEIVSADGSVPVFIHTFEINPLTQEVQVHVRCLYAMCVCIDIIFKDFSYTFYQSYASIFEYNIKEERLLDSS